MQIRKHSFCSSRKLLPAHLSYLAVRHLSSPLMMNPHKYLNLVTLSNFLANFDENYIQLLDDCQWIVLVCRRYAKFQSRVFHEQGPVINPRPVDITQATFCDRCETTCRSCANRTTSTCLPQLGWHPFGTPPENSGANHTQSQLASSAPAAVRVSSRLARHGAFWGYV